MRLEPVSACGASLTISKMHTFAVHYKHLRPALQLLVNFKLFSYYLKHMCNIRRLLLLD